jgi:uncharacterized protein
MTAFILMKLMSSYSIAMDKNFISFISSLGFYLVIFIIPVVLYIKLVDRENPFEFFKLNRKVLEGIIKGILIGCCIFVVIALKNRLVVGSNVDLRRDIFIILGRMLSGPLEEVPFRGFYLQKLRRYMGFWKANAVSSILFAGLHIPMLMQYGISYAGQVIMIFVIGLWLGYIFRETESMWCSSIVHSVYNLSLYIVH